MKRRKNIYQRTLCACIDSEYKMTQKCIEIQTFVYKNMFKEYKLNTNVISEVTMQ